MNREDIRTALAAAIEHSGAAMTLSDPHLPDCPMVAMNRSFIDLTGYTRSQMQGRNCRFLQGPQTDPDAPRRIRRCLEAGQGCIEWIVNHRADGSAFWNLLFISPIHDEDGTLLYFFGNQLDITRGSPDWLADVAFGPAQLTPALEHEFLEVVRSIGTEVGNATDRSRADALDRIVGAAHRLAEISVQLAPGTLARGVA